MSWPRYHGMLVDLAERGLSARAIAEAITEAGWPIGKGAVVGRCWRTGVRLKGKPPNAIDRTPQMMARFVELYDARLSSNAIAYHLTKAGWPITGDTVRRWIADGVHKEFLKPKPKPMAVPATVKSTTNSFRRENHHCSAPDCNTGPNGRPGTKQRGYALCSACLTKRAPERLRAGTAAVFEGGGW